MRELKFRVWNKEAETFVADFVIESAGDAVAFDNEGVAETLNSEIMQFTGLQDYEDIEMYENDIAQVEGLGKCIVAICPHYGVVFNDLNNQSVPVADCLAEQDQFRVVGNIHENPELLK